MSELGARSSGFLTSLQVEQAGRPVPLEPGSLGGNGSGSTVAISVSDGVLSLALKHVAAEHGLEAVGNEGCARFHISDRVGAAGGVVDLLLVEPSPVRSVIAVGAFRHGAVRAVLSTGEVEQFPHMIRSLQLCLATVSSSVLEASRRIPAMTSRHHAILRTLATVSHAKDSVVAARLGTSVATLKRDLTSLYESFGAGGRRELADLARTLGYSPSLSDADLGYLSQN